MSLVEHKLISKVLDDKKFYVLNKYNIVANDFYLLKDTFEYIREYVNEYGNTPDYRTIVEKFKDFNYQEDVADSFGYLCKTLKSTRAKRSAYEILQNQAGDKFSELDGTKFVDWLHSEVSYLKEVTDSAANIGVNWATNGRERLQRYEENKHSRSYQYVPTPYPSLTKWLNGGLELGDYCLLQAYIGKGKSWVSTHFGIASWRNGFGVLHYSPELTQTQMQARLDTLNGNFNNVRLRKGQLSNETKYKKYLDEFTENSDSPPYLLKTMESLPKGLTLETIEADLRMNSNIKLVIIDSFNLITHSGRGKNRDAMTNTSRKLRQMFGRHMVAGLVVHHTSTSAEKETIKEEDGMRIVNPAGLGGASETVAVSQDASTILSFDAFDGIGKILIAKCREPNVNKVVELHCDFNKGIIREPSDVDYF